MFSVVSCANYGLNRRTVQQEALPKVEPASHELGTLPEVVAPSEMQVSNRVAVTSSHKQLTLEAADELASAALAEGQARKFKPLSVSVVDATGRELVHKCHPRCAVLTPSMARAKAGACIGTHSSSRALKEKYLPDRLAQLITMGIIGSAATPQKFIAVPGGVVRILNTGRLPETMLRQYCDRAVLLRYLTTSATSNPYAAAVPRW